MEQGQQKKIPTKTFKIYNRLNSIVEKVKVDLNSDEENETLQVFNTSKKQIPKSYNLYIPENLDIDALVTNNPTNILRFNKDKLIYIISLIYSIPMRLKDFDFDTENGFIPMNSEILKFRVREYKEYLDYLCEVGVFEKRTNYKYKSGVTSSGYRFTSQYNTAPKRVKITWSRLIKSICRISSKEEKVIINVSENPLEYLEKWWNEKIQFDYQGAKLWLDSQLLKEEREGKPHCKRRYNVRRLVIEKFKNRDFIIHQDSTTGRAHTLLTQLKSELRQFIKYDGKSLVSIDITNSQPFLTIALINESPFIANNMQGRLKQYNDRHDINTSTMLALTDKKIKTNDDLLNFVEFVSKGEFYEMFGELLVEKGLVKPTEKKELRKITKKIMFASMFGHNNEKCQIKDKTTGKIKFIPNDGMKLFKETFPTVFEIFKKIKTGKHNTLACVLQNLEAELVLHKACKIISKEQPEVPIFTLHDSIITTKDNAKYVKRVLSEVLLDAIGIAPKIEEDDWIEKVA